MLSGRSRPSDKGGGGNKGGGSRKKLFRPFGPLFVLNACPKALLWYCTVNPFDGQGISINCLVFPSLLIYYNDVDYLLESLHLEHFT